MSNYDLSVRQPAPRDIVGSRLAIAACGTAFEASWEWRLTAGSETLAKGYFQAGSTGIMGTFAYEAQVEGVTYIGPAAFEFNGDTGKENPDFVSVPVVVVPGAIGYVPYQVKEGDTLTKIVRDNPWSSPIATVEAIVAANELSNPDYIEIGQELRIPV